jgi:hypothetical protein
MHGTTEEITINSDPPGATAALSDGRTGTTPFTITVPPNQDLQIHFSKAGYLIFQTIRESRWDTGWRIL